jgi:hypothetical protein
VSFDCECSLLDSSVKSLSYLPISLIEALGRATVARHYAELAINILLAALAAEPGRFGIADSRDPLETKLECLLGLSRSQLLKHDWWRTQKDIAKRAQDLNRRYSSGVTATLYGRATGSLEQRLRMMSERLGVAPTAGGITPDNLERVAAEFTAIARDACDLAETILAAAAKLSLTQSGEQPSS